MWYFCVQFNLSTERVPILQLWFLHNPRHELLSELTFWAISLDKIPFKTFWSSDISIFPQKRKMHFKYAHSAKLVEVLINKFIFSVVSTPHWSRHTMSSCYWQQKNANKTLNQSHMLCLLYTFCERSTHFDFNVETLSKLQKVGFIPFV